MRRTLAVLICVSLVLPAAGCASTGRTPATATILQPSAPDRAAMADYVQRLPAGSKVRIERTDGATVRGTLMQATDDAIVVQKNTRLPEPPIAIPVGQLARVTTENGGGAGKAVAIGIASGVGAFFAILAIAFAASGD